MFTFPSSRIREGEASACGDDGRFFMKKVYRRVPGRSTTGEDRLFCYKRAPCTRWFSPGVFNSLGTEVRGSGGGAPVVSACARSRIGSGRRLLKEKRITVLREQRRALVLIITTRAN